MLRAIERGLSLNDFEYLTFGMIFDYIIEYNNDHLDDEDKINEGRQATQSDFDRW